MRPYGPELVFRCFGTTGRYDTRQGHAGFIRGVLSTSPFLFGRQRECIMHDADLNHETEKGKTIQVDDLAERQQQQQQHSAYTDNSVQLSG